MHSNQKLASGANRFLQKEMQGIGHKRKSHVAFAKLPNSQPVANIRNGNLAMGLSQSDSAQVASWRSTPAVQLLDLT